MAHFAQLDENNIVINVIKIDDSHCMLGDTEDETIGIAFCNSLIPGVWIQTSYNDRIRKNYAGIGFTYNSDFDAFIPPQPFFSWSLDEKTFQWVSPEPKPQEGIWEWNEESMTWEEINTDPSVG